MHDGSLGRGTRFKVKDEHPAAKRKKGAPDLPAVPRSQQILLFPVPALVVMF